MRTGFDRYFPPSFPSLITRYEVYWNVAGEVFVHAFFFKIFIIVKTKFAVKYFNVYFIFNRAALRKLKIDFAKISQPRHISSMASKDRGRTSYHTMFNLEV